MRNKSMLGRDKNKIVTRAHILENSPCEANKKKKKQNHLLGLKGNETRTRPQECTNKLRTTSRNTTICINTKQDI